MRAILLLPALLALASCDTPMGTEIARKQAKTTVNNIVESKVPGVDARPVTDCVIDNATGSEIVSIAEDSVTGVTDQTVSLVYKIATRDGTVKCITSSLGPVAFAKIVTSL